MLEVRGLSVSYGAHRALENVSIRVAKGEICVILGANGAGKSSLLKAIGGLVAASGGTQILVDGEEITNAKPHRIVEAGLALVPEGRGIFGEMTVAENLQLGAYGPQARKHEAKRREEILRLFPRLGERRSQIARTMSGGEQQMVAIGRALMSNPSILMLDEPSLGLSPLLTKDLFKSLKAVRETGVGILLVEQNAKQSLAIADRGYLIENGHITGEGTGAELIRDPAVQAAYLGGAASAPTMPPARYDIADIGLLNDAEDDSVATLVERATRIQRNHVVTLREGSIGHANGHGHPVVQQLERRGEPIIMSSQASELSRRAADFADKAMRRQRAHVEANRVVIQSVPVPEQSAPRSSAPSGAVHVSAPVAPDLPVADFVRRAEAIHRNHVSAVRDANPISRHDNGDGGKIKLKGKRKKLAKKAAKLARKAEKLAEKAMR
jgi:branched-chain amino acid transport system ATP-binding protein